MKYFVSVDDHEVTLVPVDGVEIVDIPDDLIDEANEIAFESGSLSQFIDALEELVAEVAR